MHPQIDHKVIKFPEFLKTTVGVGKSFSTTAVFPPNPSIEPVSGKNLTNACDIISQVVVK